MEGTGRQADSHFLAIPPYGPDWRGLTPVDLHFQPITPDLRISQNAVSTKRTQTVGNAANGDFPFCAKKYHVVLTG